MARVPSTGRAWDARRAAGPENLGSTRTTRPTHGLDLDDQGISLAGWTNYGA